ncbi:MAG TPA: twin-arginine translocase subunit TatC [Thermodesulfobacteriota bacterium]|nr:twin-arginine translocase subunit TatC [Thermodesulfobacteriota bacterium]
MTFIEHLEELRKRMLWSLVAVIICFIPAYAFSERAFDFLMQPIINNLPEGSTLIFTRPAEGFTTYLKVAFFASLILALPFILYQVWKFVAPALYQHEKQVVVPFIFFGTVFFLIGASFCYFIAAPPAFKFLLTEYSTGYLKAMPKIDEALSFFMALILGFGIIFEFPLAVFLLARLGIVTSRMLREKRRYAILISAIAAAIITPTADAISMMFMLVPLIVFYELGILVAWVFGKKKKEVVDSEELEARS